MRRFLMIILMCLVMNFVLCSCGKANGYKKKDLVPVNETAGSYFIVANVVDYSDSITVKMENRDNLTWFFGEYYSIQVQIDGSWYYVPVTSDVTVHDLGHELEPGQSTALTYSLLPYGDLKPGHYRIACGDGGNKTNIYYAEFDITEESKATWIITNPTGLPNGYYEQPMVMYNGIVYKHYATGIAKDLPDGFVLVGTIKEFDWKSIPSDDFQATGTDLHIGQEVYANPDKPDELLVRYDDDNKDWNGYGSFYTEDAKKMDVNGYDIEMHST